MRARPLGGAALLAAVVLVASGCVYYPTVVDIGGPRILPANGRAVRQANGAVFYVELDSRGRFGDVITGVSATVARQARVVDASGQPVARFEIPGATTVAFRPGAAHVVLSDLTRPLVPGESIIVTLMFEKSGGLGIITVVEK